MSRRRQGVGAALALGLFAWPWRGAADSAALVVGIGAARLGAEAATWEARWCPPARAEAEAAFRALVADARDEANLYSQAARWFNSARDGLNPAVLLTDGVTDNLAVPNRDRVLLECRSLARSVSDSDDYVLFLAGIGKSEGIDSWVYGRTGRPLRLRELLGAAPAAAGSGRRVLVARVYPVSGNPPGHTVYAADARTAEEFRAWLERAGRCAAEAKRVPEAGRVAPGLAGLLRSAAPVRMQRIRDRVRAGAATVDGWEVLDLGRAVDSRPQEVRILLDVRESPIYEKRRKQGPFFTILEVETDKQIGVSTVADVDRMAAALAREQIASPLIAAVRERLQRDAAAAFEELVTLGGTDYRLVYNRPDTELRIYYND